MWYSIEKKALVLQPDVMFVSRERSDILNNFVEGPPDLVAEVISEGSRQYDRVSKLEWYRQYHVREYWVIDPEAQEIEVIRSTPIHFNAGPIRRGDAVRSGCFPDFAEAAAARSSSWIRPD